MASNETGARWGWSLGSLGGLLWILPLGGVLFYKGDAFGGAVAAVWFAAGVAYIIWAAPWRHPDRPFWKAYLGLLLLVYGAAGFMIWRMLPAMEDRAPLWPLASAVLPMLTPFFLFGKKTWRQMHGVPPGEEESDAS